MTDLPDILKRLMPLVREAGTIAGAGFGRSIVLSDKEGGDLATDMDLKVNGFLVSGLKRVFPAAGIVSEESGATGRERDDTWIVDPIDGSKHYARGIPLYAVSVALQRKGQLVLGVVHAPSTGETFSAFLGGGATRNGNAITCSRETRLNRAILCAELPSRHGGQAAIRIALNRLEALMMGCQRIRVVGVTTLGLCYCASGAFDAYVNLGSSPNALWDTAAGEVIAREAGCELSRNDGLTVVGNPDLHLQIMERLAFKQR